MDKNLDRFDFYEKMKIGLLQSFTVSLKKGKRKMKKMQIILLIVVTIFVLAGSSAVKALEPMKPFIGPAIEGSSSLKLFEPTIKEKIQRIIPITMVAIGIFVIVLGIGHSLGKIAKQQKEILGNQRKDGEDLLKRGKQPIHD